MWVVWNKLQIAQWRVLVQLVVLQGSESESEYHFWPQPLQLFSYFCTYLCYDCV